MAFIGQTGKLKLISKRYLINLTQILGILNTHNKQRISRYFLNLILKTLSSVLFKGTLVSIREKPQISVV